MKVCTGTKRIYVHKDIYPQLLKALSTATKRLKVGGPEEEGVLIGPLQNKMQFEKIKAVYEEVEKGKYAVEKGQQVGSNGFFLQPTIIDNPPNDSLIMIDEQMVNVHLLIVYPSTYLFRVQLCQCNRGQMKRM